MSSAAYLFLESQRQSCIICKRIRLADVLKHHLDQFVACLTHNSGTACHGFRTSWTFNAHPVTLTWSDQHRCHGSDMPTTRPSDFAQ
jgi:hypothetical protein